MPSVGTVVVVVVVELTLGGARSFLSKEPMSQTTVPFLSPSFLTTPRWSSCGQAVASAASTAGLPGRRAWVSVGPPLFCRGLRRGLVFCLSVVFVNSQLSSVLILLPCDEITPPLTCAVSQLSSVLLATVSLPDYKHP